MRKSSWLEVLSNPPVILSVGLAILIVAGGLIGWARGGWYPDEITSTKLERIDGLPYELVSYDGEQRWYGRNIGGEAPGKSSLGMPLLHAPEDLHPAPGCGDLAVAREGHITRVLRTATTERIQLQYPKSLNLSGNYTLHFGPRVIPCLVSLNKTNLPTTAANELGAFCYRREAYLLGTGGKQISVSSFTAIP